MSLAVTFFPSLTLLQIGMKVYFLSASLATVGLAMLFVLAFITCWRPKQPIYIRGLPIYFFVCALTEVLAAILPTQSNYLYAAFAMAETLFFSYLFSQLLDSRPSRIFIYTANLLFVILGFFAAFFIPILRVMTIERLAESTILVLCAILYFRKIIESHHLALATRQPSFYLVLGIFFYFIVAIPATGFTALYLATKEKSLGQLVYSINNFALIVFYILFAKAMLYKIK